jgi:hypothetical protein
MLAHDSHLYSLKKIYELVKCLFIFFLGSYKFFVIEKESGDGLLEKEMDNVRIASEDLDMDIDVLRQGEDNKLNGLCAEQKRFANMSLVSTATIAEIVDIYT